jgi:hypothetical protein
MGIGLKSGDRCWVFQCGDSSRFEVIHTKHRNQDWFGSGEYLTAGAGIFTMPLDTEIIGDTDTYELVAIDSCVKIKVAGRYAIECLMYANAINTGLSYAGYFDSSIVVYDPVGMTGTAIGMTPRVSITENGGDVYAGSVTLIGLCDIPKDSVVRIDGLLMEVMGSSQFNLYQRLRISKR